MRRSGVFLLALVAFVSTFAIESQAQSLMTHHVREAIRNGQAHVAGQLPADQIMNLNIVLPLGDAAGLDNFLRDLYDPTSASYRHFLTVAQFTERFGPSQEDYDAVVSFVKM